MFSGESLPPLKPAEWNAWYPDWGKKPVLNVFFFCFFWLAQCYPSCAVRCEMTRRLRLGGGDAAPRGGYFEVSIQFLREPGGEAREGNG